MHKIYMCNFQNLPHIVPFNYFYLRREHQTIVYTGQNKYICLMINFDLGPARILGSVIILFSCSLYNARISIPKIGKETAIVIFSIGTLVGGILIFQGWRLDPLLLFSQILTTSVAVCFAIETLKLRKLIADQIFDL